MTAQITGVATAAARKQSSGTVPVHAGVAHQVKRAARYRIEAPLQFRVLGERVWHSGTTHNMSETGILFHGDAELRAGVHLDMHVDLTVTFPPNRKIALTFRAVVIRGTEGGRWGARIYARRVCRTVRDNGRR